MSLSLRTAAAALCLAVASTAGLSGCSGGMMGMDPTKAMSMLSGPLKDAANGYLGGMGDVTKLLGSVTDKGSATSALPKLTESFGKLGGFNKTLSAAKGDDLKNLSGAFGPKIADANKGYMSQVSRLLGNKDTSSVLKSALDGFKPFKF
jgi:hypothetical protein